MSEVRRQVCRAVSGVPSLCDTDNVSCFHPTGTDCHKDVQKPSRNGPSGAPLYDQELVAANCESHCDGPATATWPLTSDQKTGTVRQKLLLRKGSLVNPSGRSRWQRPGVAVPTKVLLAAILLAASMTSGFPSPGLCAPGACGSDCPMHQAAADPACCDTESRPASPREAESTQQGCSCGAQDTSSPDVRLLPENRPATDRHSPVVAVLPAPTSVVTTHTRFARSNSGERVRLVLVLATPGPRAPPTA